MNSETANALAHEIDKFDQLAQDWWDEKGPMRPLHQMNPIRLQFIDRCASIKDKSVLDVGCGAGLLSEAMASMGAKVTAVDLSQAVIDVATEHAAMNDVDITYQKNSIETIAESGQQFEIITCMEMLEHVPDPLTTIKACYTSLTDNGFLFLSTLNRNPKSYLFSIILAEYVARLLPIGTHEYRQFIKPSELCTWCRQVGLSLIELQGISYRPISQTFAPSNDIDINYMACFQKTGTTHD